MDFKELATEILETGRDLTLDWVGNSEGITSIHLENLNKLAKSIQLIVCLCVQAINDNIPVISDNPSKDAHEMIVAALISAFEMGRASAKGDK